MADSKKPEYFKIANSQNLVYSKKASAVCVTICYTVYIIGRMYAIVQLTFFHLFFLLSFPWPLNVSGSLLFLAFDLVLASESVCRDSTRQAVARHIYFIEPFCTMWCIIIITFLAACYLSSMNNTCKKIHAHLPEPV